MKINHTKLFGLLIMFLLTAAQTASAFELKTEKVTDRIYALVGPINARTYDNHALNNTMGFIITDKGVVLIDSGASFQGAALIEKTIAAITDKPVKWVINTGAQDHRWMGNEYFAAKGAQIIALARTLKNHKDNDRVHMLRLKQVLKDHADGTVPLYAPNPIEADKKVLNLGGIELSLIWPGGAHFPDDIIVWVPSQKTVFAGDLVFNDRMLGIQGDGSSVVRDWNNAFKTMAALKPEHVVPGHGSSGDLAKARRDTGDYLDWLMKNIEPAVGEMEDIGHLVNRLGDAPFKHLKHYDSWHRKNVNRTYLQLESE